MTEVQVRRVAGSTYVARGPTNHWVVMDTSKADGGHEGGSAPMELVLMALGGCTGIDVELMLRKMRIFVEDFRIEVSGEPAESPPRVYTTIEVAYHFWGRDLPRNKLERAVKLSHETYCSVANMLKQVVTMTTSVVVHDEIPPDLLG